MGIIKKNWLELLFLAVLVLSMTSCVSTKKLIYMQGIESIPKDSLKALQNYELHIQPDDQLAISINSKNEELIMPFNNNLLVGSGNSVSGASTVNSQAGITYFQVNKDGMIHFPILGDLKVEGMTRNQIESMIEQKLITGNHVKDPSVSVKLMSFKVTVLGEVTNPGVIKLTNERLTILEALGMAGDLQPSGQRQNILVMRDVNGVRQPYVLDLTDARNILNSPCYYLQQNDVVYVQPNSAIKVKGSAATTYLSTTGTFVSIAASILSLLVVILK